MCLKSRTKKGLFLSLVGLLIGCLYWRTFVTLFYIYRGSNYYSYAFLIPLVSGFLIWRKRNELHNTTFESSRFGFVLVSFALILLLAGKYGDVFFLKALSFVVLLAGVVLHLFGKLLTRVIKFPIFFLFFMVPAVKVLEAFSLRLQLLSASFAALILGIFATPVVLDGLNVHIGTFSLAVEAPCNGLNSLLTMSALAVLYVHFVTGQNTEKARFKIAKQVALLLSVVPIVLFANSLRIGLVGGIGYHFGENAAMGFFHFGSGLLVIVISFALLVSVGHLLRFSAEEN